MAQNKQTIAVMGDVAIDWLLMRPGGKTARDIDLAWAWNTGFAGRMISTVGGAAHHAEIIAALVARDERAGMAVAGPAVPAEALSSPDYGAFARSYTSWAPFPVSLGDKTQYTWRITSFLGESPPAEDEEPPASPSAAAPDVLVLDDHNLGFRDHPERWSAEVEGGPKAIVAKWHSPLGQGALWDRLQAQHADKLTVVVWVDDLRKDSLLVGYPLSWEQIYQEIVEAVRGSRLASAARVVVQVGLSGVVIVTRDGGSTLVFDPRSQEGDWDERHPGRVIGYLTCLSAALAYEIAVAGAAADVTAAAARGLAGARALQAAGFEETRGSQGPGLRFPMAEVTDALLTGGDRLPRVSLDFETGGDRSILVEMLGEGNMERIATEAALHGADRMLAGIPVETVGDWSSVDRGEIESMRSVRNIMGEYVDRYRRGERLGRPLSIAVFGPPGSGKSFAVKQIAKALLPGELKILEFNVSQFQSPSELPAAFHIVRDLVLQQHLPLVFWDEFDTSLEGLELGWLRHFLAPMQDGMFREGGVFHPIGPAVFVFAGGTSSTLNEFITAGDEAAARNAKKPDFLSRLRGFVNIHGPNELGGSDAAYVLRRAFLLRSLLERKAPQIFRGHDMDIDAGLLHAFLTIDRFYHGARSLESIVDMSTLAGKPRYERSSLPPRHQLALHVEARRFLELVREANGPAGARNSKRSRAKLHLADAPEARSPKKKS